jgi:hypothetical protein
MVVKIDSRERFTSEKAAPSERFKNLRIARFSARFFG